MLKALLLLCAAFLSVSIHAAPTEQEVWLCQLQGISAYEAAVAKKQGVTKEQFDAAVARILADPDIPEPAKSKGVAALRQGWVSKKAPEVIGQELFDSCMNAKQI